MNWGEFCQWGWHMAPWGMGWGWFGRIAMVVFWVGVILGIVLLVRWLVTSPGHAQREESALEILKKRYAWGRSARRNSRRKRKTLFKEVKLYEEGDRYSGCRGDFGTFGDGRGPDGAWDDGLWDGPGLWCRTGI